MTDSVAIQTCGSIEGSIQPPGSKSITNRALVCAAMAKGDSTLRGVLDSEDTQVMVAGLRALGVEVEHDKHSCTAVVRGCRGRIPIEKAELFVANSGTTIRFLTAMLAATSGNFRLDGIERMRERPIGDLLDALNQIGANVSSESNNGCPPVVLDSNGLAGGTCHIRGNISSQYLSGLLMAAPYAHAATTIEVDGTLVSVPYVEMTLSVMRSFGVDIVPGDLSRFSFPGNQHYDGLDYDIEPDASAASYFWAAAAITGGRVTVEGLSRDALQGDVGFCECLEAMGCGVHYEPNGITVEGATLSGVTLDMNAISDTVQTLSAVALFANGPTTIRNVAHIRHKETDRIGDLARELRKLGATVDEFEDGMTITPGELKPAVIDTYNDHRMAMSLALVGLRVPGVVINDPGCTAKTYPHFFEDLARLTASAK